MNDALKRFLGVDPDGHGAADAARLHGGLEAVAEPGVRVVI